MSVYRRACAAFFAVALSAGSVMPIAHAEEPSQGVVRFAEERKESLDVYPHEADSRRDALLAAGFEKVGEYELEGRLVETYRKELPEGGAIEYDVLNKPSSPQPRINFDWDWGPRIYMTGEEFWGLGATGLASAVCGFLGKSVKFSTACGVAAQALWNKVTAHQNWAHDKTCYDLSQFMNIGWEVAPQEKCD